MKKIILSSLMMILGVAFVSAQCSKSATAACCSSKKTAEASTSNTAITDMSAAEIAAAADQTIQKRQCPESGTMTFFQKSVNEESGKAVWNEVKFDEATKKFTQVASVMMEKTAEGPKEVKKSEGCSKDATKACCAAKKESGL
jgi:hypothetical protein